MREWKVAGTTTMRTTIRGLMASILGVAAVLCCLKYPTMWLATGLFALEISLFGVAALLGMRCAGNVRGACAGWVVFGLFYLHADMAMESPFAEPRIAPPPLIDVVIMHSTKVEGNELHNRCVEILDENFYDHMVHIVGTVVFAGVGASIGTLSVSFERRRSRRDLK